MNKIEYRTRCWIYKQLYLLALRVAPVEVRAIQQEAVDRGLNQMQKEK